MQNCKLFNNIRMYVFKQVVKKQKTNINNIKYNKKSKKHFDYTVNIETNTEDINLNKNNAKKDYCFVKKLS